MWPGPLASWAASCRVHRGRDVMPLCGLALCCILAGGLLGSTEAIINQTTTLEPDQTTRNGFIKNIRKDDFGDFVVVTKDDDGVKQNKSQPNYTTNVLLLPAYANSNLVSNESSDQHEELQISQAKKFNYYISQEDVNTNRTNNKTDADNAIYDRTVTSYKDGKNLNESIELFVDNSTEQSLLLTTVLVSSIKPNKNHANKAISKNAQKNNVRQRHHGFNKQTGQTYVPNRQHKVRPKFIPRKTTLEPKLNTYSGNESTFDYKNMMVDLISRLNAKVGKQHNITKKTRYGIRSSMIHNISSTHNINNGTVNPESLESNKIKMILNFINNFLCHKTNHERHIPIKKGTACRKSRDMSESVNTDEVIEETSFETKIKKLRGQMFDVLLTIEQIKRSLQMNKKGKLQNNKFSKDSHVTLQESIWRKLYESYINRTRPIHERNFQNFKINFMQKMGYFVNTFKKIIEFLSNDTNSDATSFHNDRNQRRAAGTLTASNNVVTSPATETVPERITYKKQEITNLKWLLKTINNIHNEFMQKIIELVDNVENSTRKTTTNQSNEMDKEIFDIINKLKKIKDIKRQTDRKKRSTFKDDETAIHYLLSLLEVFLKDYAVNEPTEDGINDLVDGIQAPAFNQLPNLKLKTSKVFKKPTDFFASEERGSNIIGSSIEGVSPTVQEVSVHPSSSNQGITELKAVANQIVDVYATAETTTNSNDVHSHKIFFYSTSDYYPRVNYENGDINNSGAISHLGTERTRINNYKENIDKYDLYQYPAKQSKLNTFSHGRTSKVMETTKNSFGNDSLINNKAAYQPNLATNLTTEKLEISRSPFKYYPQKLSKSTLETFNLFGDYSNEFDETKNRSDGKYKNTTILLKKGTPGLELNYLNYIDRNEISDYAKSNYNFTSNNMEHQINYIQTSNSTTKGTGESDPIRDANKYSEKITKKLEVAKRKELPLFEYLDYGDPDETFKDHLNRVSLGPTEKHDLVNNIATTQNIELSEFTTVKGYLQGDDIDVFKGNVDQNLQNYQNLPSILRKDMIDLQLTTSKKLTSAEEIRIPKSETTGKLKSSSVSNKDHNANPKHKNSYHFDDQGNLETPIDYNDMNILRTNTILQVKKMSLLDSLDYGELENSFTENPERGFENSVENHLVTNKKSSSINKISGTDNAVNILKALKDDSEEYIDMPIDKVTKLYQTIVANDSLYDQEIQENISKLKYKPESDFLKGDELFQSEHFQEDLVADDIPSYFE